MREMLDAKGIKKRGLTEAQEMQLAPAALNEPGEQLIQEPPVYGYVVSGT